MEASTQISDMDIMLAGNKNKSMLTKNVKTTRKVLCFNYMIK